MKKTILSLILISLLFIPANYVEGQTNSKTNKTPVSSAVQKGSLKIKAGVVLKSGDIKYIAKQSFYLTPIDFKTILLKKLAAKTTLQEQLSFNGITKEKQVLELVDYKTVFQKLDGERKITRENFSTAMRDSDFQEAKSDEDARFKYRMGYVTYQQMQQLRLQAIDTSEATKKKAFNDAGKAIEETKTFNQFYREAVAEAQEQIKTSIVGTCDTDFNGECKFNNLKPNKYYLISTNIIEIGDNRLFWNVPLRINPNQITNIELSNDNLLWVPQ